MKEVTFQGLKDDKLAFALVGDIDAGNAEEFYEVVVSAYESAPSSLYFDCENEFICMLTKMQFGVSEAILTLAAKTSDFFLFL